MFKRLFGKPKHGSTDIKPHGQTDALMTIEKLDETLEMLEKREALLQKKMADEIAKAKEYTKMKNKRAALQCLKRKKLYEAQADQLANQQLRIHDQKIMLEGAKATTETVSAMRTGAQAMKKMQKETNIEDVDKTMEEITEQTEAMRQINEALGQPVGLAAEIDEDELDLELQELEAEELDRQLMEPAVVPSATTAARTEENIADMLPKVPALPAKSKEDEELEALQAEMAL
mmetsp:Transcript_6538/g.16634  ORF Transcript_6538/g.16634 Transcript_6538/m.16634 type:complete len:232 (-) Transcript_6538:370-1065(-)